MATKLQIQYIADPNIDNTQKALILPLEFALIENLDRDDGRILDGTEIVG